MFAHHYFSHQTGLKHRPHVGYTFRQIRPKETAFGEKKAGQLQVGFFGNQFVWSSNLPILILGLNLKKIAIQGNFFESLVLKRKLYTISRYHSATKIGKQCNNKWVSKWLHDYLKRLKSTFFFKNSFTQQNYSVRNNPLMQTVWLP